MTEAEARVLDGLIDRFTWLSPVRLLVRVNEELLNLQGPASARVVALGKTRGVLREQVAIYDQIIYRLRGVQPYDRVSRDPVPAEKIHELFETPMRTLTAYSGYTAEQAKAYAGIASQWDEAFAGQQLDQSTAADFAEVKECASAWASASRRINDAIGYLTEEINLKRSVEN